MSLGGLVPGGEERGVEGGVDDCAAGLHGQSFCDRGLDRIERRRGEHELSEDARVLCFVAVESGAERKCFGPFVGDSRPVVIGEPERSARVGDAVLHTVAGIIALGCEIAADVADVIVGAAVGVHTGADRADLAGARCV